MSIHSRLLPALLAAALYSSAAPGPQVSAEDMMHEVAPGETLSAIALWYQTSEQALMDANGIADPNFIYAGQLIRIVPPLPPAQEAAPPAPAIAPAPESAAEPAAPPPPATTAEPPAAVAPPASSAPAMRHHVVAPGETAFSIANRYGVSLGQLAEANGLTNLNYIQAGQSLAIPVSSPPAAAAPRVYTGRAATKIILDHAAREYGLEPRLLYAVAWYESGWQQHARSHARAMGLMQIVPETGDWLTSYVMRENVDWRNNELGNARVGAAYLRYLLIRAHGDLGVALAAYYQGWGSVSRIGRYAETERYIANVWALMNMEYWPGFGPAPWLTPAIS